MWTKRRVENTGKVPPPSFHLHQPPFLKSNLNHLVSSLLPPNRSPVRRPKMEGLKGENGRQRKKEKGFLCPPLPSISSSYQGPIPFPLYIPPPRSPPPLPKEKKETKTAHAFMEEEEEEDGGGGVRRERRRRNEEEEEERRFSPPPKRGRKCRDRSRTTVDWRGRERCRERERAPGERPS